MDAFTSMYPVKYRWPVFDLSRSPAEQYEAIIDEECKVRLKTPHVSKFRDSPMDLDDKVRKQHFIECAEKIGRTDRAAYVEAFFRASFTAWKDFNASGKESIHVGYSPIIGVDAGLICADLPAGHVLHVVRNPFSGYADTKKRPVPLSLRHYVTAWVTCLHQTLAHQQAFPDRIHVLRFEDIIEDPVGRLGEVCKAMGSGPADSLATPSWNGRKLEQVYPWGTIRTPTPEVNRATAAELSDEERKQVAIWTGPYIEKMGYQDWV
jgi:hypothetical protein